MKLDYESFCEKFENDITLQIEEDIYDLNLPTRLKERVFNVIMENMADVLEERYEYQVGEYEDRAYEEYRDNKMMGED